MDGSPAVYKAQALGILREHSITYWYLLTPEDGWVDLFGQNISGNLLKGITSFEEQIQEAIAHWVKPENKTELHLRMLEYQDTIGYD